MRAGNYSERPPASRASALSPRASSSFRSTGSGSARPSAGSAARSRRRCRGRPPRAEEIARCSARSALARRGSRSSVASRASQRCAQVRCVAVARSGAFRIAQAPAPLPLQLGGDEVAPRRGAPRRSVRACPPRLAEAAAAAAATARALRGDEHGDRGARAHASVYRRRQRHPGDSCACGRGRRRTHVLGAAAALSGGTRRRSSPRRRPARPAPGAPPCGPVGGAGRRAGRPARGRTPGGRPLRSGSRA